MCPDCYNELNFSDIKTNRIINGVNIFSCGKYDKNLQKLIRGLKYHKQKELAYYLAKFMFEYFLKLKLEGQFQVVPVPLHKNRIKKRKYNHMELVAEEFCRLSGYTPNFDLIKRIKDTKPQYKLTKKERMQNLADAFIVDKSKLLYRSSQQNLPTDSTSALLPNLPLTVLIIDDICTTGSTFEEMISALKKEGINNIVCLASSTP